MDHTGLTKGVKNALARREHHSMCPDCGFALPRYPGRYPKSCPSCGTERKVEEGSRLGVVAGEIPEIGGTITHVFKGVGTIVEADVGVAWVECLDGSIEEIR
jgi:hypothetical protein